MRHRARISVWVRAQRCAWHALSREAQQAHAALLLLVVCIAVSAAFAAPELQSSEPPVHADGLVVTIPVLVAVLLFVAGATWAVAQFDMKRVRKMDRLARDIEQHKHELVRLRRLINRMAKHQGFVDPGEDNEDDHANERDQGD